jgi:hypothetical protein
MENTILAILDWSDFLKVIVLLAAIYFGILLLKYMSRHSSILRRIEAKTSKQLKSISILYEPIIVIIITLVIIKINPILYGLIIAALLAIAYQPIKNYIDGKIFLLNNIVKKGQHIYIFNEDSTIQTIGRFGIVLTNGKGSRFIHYSQLAKENYTLLKGVSTGSFHQLLVTANDTNAKKTAYGMDFLMEKLLDCPYLNWTFKPDIQPSETDHETYVLEILLNKDSHLNYMIQLITESGFSCKNLSNSKHL